jgi:hypothetical protein
VSAHRTRARPSHAPARADCSEATSFALELQRHTKVRLVQHGDSYSQDYVDGLDRRTAGALEELFTTPVDPASAVVVCHSEPGAWHPARYHTTRCPPAGERWSIGCARSSRPFPPRV